MRERLKATQVSHTRLRSAAVLNPIDSLPKDLMRVSKGQMYHGNMVQVTNTRLTQAAEFVSNVGTHLGG